MLCPTRELALQIYNEFERMNAGLPADEQLSAVAVYGGTAYGPQLDAFEKGAHLVVGTPGRVLDHLSRGTLNLSQLQMLVLDEADEMLSMGFYPDMMKLKRYLPKVRDGYMFSATMPFQVQRIGQEFLNDPIFIATSGGTIHVDLMTHRAFAVDPRAQGPRARDAHRVGEPDVGRSSSPTRAARWTTSRRFLTNYGLDAAGISSDLTQKAREEVMGRLRAGELRFLVATDVAARGIDVEDLSHVFHYDVPQDPEYYVHRSGRTARAGKAGVSISLMTATDAPSLRGIARRYSIPLEEMDVPTEEELATRVAERLTRHPRGRPARADAPRARAPVALRPGRRAPRRRGRARDPRDAARRRLPAVAPRPPQRPPSPPAARPTSRSTRPAHATPRPATHATPPHARRRTPTDDSRSDDAPGRRRPGRRAEDAPHAQEEALVAQEGGGRRRRRRPTRRDRASRRRARRGLRPAPRGARRRRGTPRAAAPASATRSWPATRPSTRPARRARSRSSSTPPRRPTSSSWARSTTTRPGHAVEFAVLQRASPSAPTGRPVVLALEMFEADVQTVLDEYLAGTISERDFLDAARPWPNYATDYRPLVEFARAHRHARRRRRTRPSRYVRAVGRGGDLGGRRPGRRAACLPPLPVAPASDAMAAAFAEAMGDMSGHGGPSLGGMLAAQNLRDASMAFRTSEALRTAEAGRGPLVVHVNGGFHTAGGRGIPEHLARLAPRARVFRIAIEPVADVDAAPVGPESDAVVQTPRRTWSRAGRASGRRRSPRRRAGDVRRDEPERQRGTARRSRPRSRPRG